MSPVAHPQGWLLGLSPSEKTPDETLNLRKFVLLQKQIQGRSVMLC